MAEIFKLHASHRKSPGRLPTAESADDLPLGEDGEALVEPEVLKIIIGHQVAGPGWSFSDVVSSDFTAVLLFQILI